MAEKKSVLGIYNISSGLQAKEAKVAKKENSTWLKSDQRTLLTHALKQFRVGIPE